MRAALLVVCILAVVALGIAAPVAAAGNPGRACPGDNPNVGYENAHPTGAVHSSEGIVGAFDAIGCQGESISGTAA